MIFANTTTIGSLEIAGEIQGNVELRGQLGMLDSARDRKKHLGLAESTAIFVSSTLSALALTGASLPAQAEGAVKNCSSEANVKTLPTISLGDTGTCVDRVQLDLVNKSYMTPSQADGIYGPTTRGEVISFQINNNIKGVDGTIGTGNVGKVTWPLLEGKPNKKPVLPVACTEVPMSICVNKDDSTLRLVENGTVTLKLAARFGDTRGPVFRTPEGVKNVYYKNANLKSEKYGGALMPNSLCFVGSVCVHYSYAFAADPVVDPGEGSHGCVNLRDLKGSYALFNKVPVGTRVVVK